MKSKERLVKDIMKDLAQLKESIDTDNKLSLEEYDYQYGDVEDIQYKMYQCAKNMGFVE